MDGSRPSVGRIAADLQWGRSSLVLEPHSATDIVPWPWKPNLAVGKPADEWSVALNPNDRPEARRVSFDTDNHTKPDGEKQLGSNNRPRLGFQIGG